MNFNWTRTLEPVYDGCVMGYECNLAVGLFLDLEVRNEFTDDFNGKQWAWRVAVSGDTLEKGICATSKQAKKKAEKAMQRMLDEIMVTGGHR